MSEDFTLAAAAATKGSAQFGPDNCRYELRRWWAEEPVAWAAWLMLNPSYAGEESDDPTSRRTIHFSKSAGCGGLILVNLFPYISSQPSRLWGQAASRDVASDLQLNLAAIEEAARQATRRFVAFGAEALRRCEPWLEQCLEAYRQPSSLPDADEQLYCLGVNSQGQPKHPMARGKHRIPDGFAPIPWRRP